MGNQVRDRTSLVPRLQKGRRKRAWLTLLAHALNRSAIPQEPQTIDLQCMSVHSWHQNRYSTLHGP